eukprot:g13963.t1
MKTTINADEREKDKEDEDQEQEEEDEEGEQDEGVGKGAEMTEKETSAKRRSEDIDKEADEKEMEENVIVGSGPGTSRTTVPSSAPTDDDPFNEQLLATANVYVALWSINHVLGQFCWRYRRHLPAWVQALAHNHHVDAAENQAVVDRA